MTLKRLPQALSVLKVQAREDIPMGVTPLYVGISEEEISVVCPTDTSVTGVCAREDGFRGLRIVGVLDFSLVGVLSRVSGVLAAGGIALFALSTFNTDTILVKEEAFDAAVRLLCAAGMDVE